MNTDTTEKEVSTFWPFLHDIHAHRLTADDRKIFVSDLPCYIT